MNERDGHIVTPGVRVRDSEIKLEKVAAVLNLDIFIFFFFTLSLKRYYRTQSESEHNNV